MPNRTTPDWTGGLLVSMLRERWQREQRTISMEDLGEADPLEERLLTDSSLGFFDLTRELSLGDFVPTAA